MVKTGLINEDCSMVKIGDEVSAYYFNGWHRDGMLEEIWYESGSGGELVIDGSRVDIDLIEKIVKLKEE
jgi:hypothetical protein